MHSRQSYVKAISPAYSFAQMPSDSVAHALSNVSGAATTGYKASAKLQLNSTMR